VSGMYVCMYVCINVQWAGLSLKSDLFQTLGSRNFSEVPIFYQDDSVTRNTADATGSLSQSARQVQVCHVKYVLECVNHRGG
jgi:hypothetical protein